MGEASSLILPPEHLMSLYVVSQAAWPDGETVPRDVIIGLAIGDDPDGARAAIPPDAILGPDWHAYEPKLTRCGEFDPRAPTFIKWGSHLA